MALERRVVDTITGEIKSRGTLGENNNFIMLFRNQISSIVEIQKTDPKAGALFLFFLEHMDRENALIVSIETIAELMDWSIATVNRKIKFLKEKKFIQTKRTGNSSVYFINANIAWTTYANKKEYAKFKASVLVSKSEQQYKVASSRFKKIDLKTMKPEGES